MRRSFLLLALLLSIASGGAGASLTPKQLERIGQRIWLNEGAGRIEYLIHWNEGEPFPSLGIGHFIWYPPGVEAPFEESFPKLLAHLAKTGITLPEGITPSNDAPWPDRATFLARRHLPPASELRALLAETVPQQTEFIVQRFRAALPKMKAAMAPARRDRLEHHFQLLAKTPEGLFAMIDYVNFKGEGTAPQERYKGEGWGLMQVLDAMEESQTPRQALEHFVTAADRVLTRRITNAPRDESRWLLGGRKWLRSSLKLFE